MGQGSDFPREGKRDQGGCPTSSVTWAPPKTPTSASTHTEHWGNLAWLDHLGTARNRNTVFDGQCTRISAMTPRPPPLTAATHASRPRPTEELIPSLAPPQCYWNRPHANEELTPTSLRRTAPAAVLSRASHHRPALEPVRSGSEL